MSMRRARRAAVGIGVLAVVLSTTLPAPVAAAEPGAGAAAARAFVGENEPSVLREFVELLSLPNVASDAPNIRRNAEHIRGMLERRGLQVEILDGAGGPPVVYAERRTPGARRTLMIYAHYDGQPVVEAQWSSPPFAPVLVDRPRPEGGRPVDLAALRGPAPPEAYLYARSAGDDKAPIQALVSALDALERARLPLSANLKVFLEGEEEAGSPHLRAVLEREKERLAADLWLFCDGPVHQTRRPQLALGARGVMDLELTLYGPVRPLHSGHYGNWAPNPAAELAGLLARLRDDEGRILIPGFYDDVRPPSPSERQALAKAPAVDRALRNELALGRTEGAAEAAPRLEERILLPALNVRGLQSGSVGDKAQNAVPAEARLSIDFRLVPDQTPARVRERVLAHLRSLGYEIVDEAPSLELRRQAPRLVRLGWGLGYPAYRASLEDPAASSLLPILERAAGQPFVVLPTLGGSLPLHVFADVLRAPIVVLPIANHDNNQHAANENLRVQNLRDGIALYAAVLTEWGQVLN